MALVRRRRPSRAAHRGSRKLRSPTAVAASLKRTALRSRRRKASPYQSAVSMPKFYINRAGKGLNPSRRRVLGRAKGELRKALGRKPKSDTLGQGERDPGKVIATASRQCRERETMRFEPLAQVMRRA